MPATVFVRYRAFLKTLNNLVSNASPNTYANILVQANHNDFFNVLFIILSILQSSPTVVCVKIRKKCNLGKSHCLPQKAKNQRFLKKNSNGAASR